MKVVVVIPGNYSDPLQIADACFIFSAETKAIDLALKFHADCIYLFFRLHFGFKPLDHTCSTTLQIQKDLEKHNVLSKYNETI